MTTELQVIEPAILEKVLMNDLSSLNPQQRVKYISSVCNSLGLNPATQPFDYITLNGRLTLYAKKNAAEQLCKLHGVSIDILSREITDDVYVVTARATTHGRSNESIGAVSISGLKGEAKANAFMKAETKAKRRVVFSLLGLGMLDETEVSSISRENYSAVTRVQLPTAVASKPPAPTDDETYPLRTETSIPPGGMLEGFATSVSTVTENGWNKENESHRKLVSDALKATGNKLSKNDKAKLEEWLTGLEPCQDTITKSVLEFFTP